VLINKIFIYSFKEDGREERKETGKEEFAAKSR